MYAEDCRLARAFVALINEDGAGSAKRDSNKAVRRGLLRPVMKMLSFWCVRQPVTAVCALLPGAPVTNQFRKPQPSIKHNSIATKRYLHATTLTLRN